jgi:Aerotolerance regulator N-terminal/von Willebrand factor type A domain
MGLLSPWFLAAAALVGLPLYLHLLRRHKANPRPFSSLMFFERRTQSSIRHRRLRHLLLLSLRIAVLLSLALVFANPFINRSVAGMGGNKLVLLVIDNSFSMRAGSRLADAQQAALAVLRSRNPGDRAQVMTLGSELHVLTHETQERGELQEAVQRITPGDSCASFGELARGLRFLAQTVPTPIELHLFSDLQKSNLPASFQELTLPPNVRLIPHAVVKNAAPNWTVESVTAPGQVWDLKKARVEAVVVGFHTPAATRTVSLVVNGKTIATRSVSLRANGRATIEFESLDVPYGFSRCEVRIDSADSLPADDQFLFSVERSDPRHVLFLHEASDSRSPLYFRSALTAAAETAFTVETLTVDQAANTQPSRYAFVVLSDVLSLPSAYEENLLNYVRSGGSVLIALGTSAARRAHIPIFGGDILAAHNYSRAGQSFLTVGEADPTHASIAKADRWANVQFYFAVEPDTANSRVVARLTDGTPLLVEKKLSEGRALLFTSGLDNLTNDFPMRPIFVPFIEQTARYLSGMERPSRSRVVDSFFELRTDKDHAASVEVVDPDGRRPLSLKEAASAQTFRLSRSGFYEIRLADGRHEVIGVNADRRESDLDVIPEDVLALWQGNATPAPQPAAVAGTVQQQTKPHSVWWYFMLLLLAAAVAESLVSDRYLGKLREEP